MRINLFAQSVCSDAGSFDITAPFLGGCIEEANEAYVVAVKRQESGGHAQVSLLSLAKLLFKTISKDCRIYCPSQRATVSLLRAMHIEYARSMSQDIMICCIVLKL